MSTLHTNWTRSPRSRLAVNAKDGSVLLRVPAGEFEMGDGQDTNCPKHVVHVDEYWVGVYCVTNRQYARFVRERKHAAPNGGPWTNGICRADAVDHPVTDVSWDDAWAYAKWAGLSLRTEAQWEKAARGPLGLVYPWGSAWEADLCWHNENRGSGNTAEVWRYGGGASGYGTYQQSGNVWEWCEDWYNGDYYGESAPENPCGPDGGSARVFRGGSWWNGLPSRFRGTFRNGYDQPYCRGYLGFRIVRTIS